MILNHCGIMSPVAYLKEVLTDQSSFHCISMTFFKVIFFKATILISAQTKLYYTYLTMSMTMSSNVYMFADDTIIYRTMTSHEDTNNLQNDLDCLQSWSVKWLHNFDLHKCKAMSITKSTACSHDTADYYLENKVQRLAAHQFIVAPKK